MPLPTPGLPPEAPLSHCLAPDAPGELFFPVKPHKGTRHPELPALILKQNPSSGRTNWARRHSSATSRRAEAPRQQIEYAESHSDGPFLTCGGGKKKWLNLPCICLSSAVRRRQKDGWMDGSAAVCRSITRLSAPPRQAGCGQNRMGADKPASFRVCF